MPFADTAVRLLLPMIGGDSNSDGAVSPRNNSHKANGALSTSNLALITFLTEKMKAAKSNHDSVVCTILGTWLTELHLQEREIREEQNVRQQKRTGLCQPAAANKALLHQFLSSFVRDMDAKSIIKVLASHDISAGECAGFYSAADRPPSRGRGLAVFCRAPGSAALGWSPLLRARAPDAALGGESGLLP